MTVPRELFYEILEYPLVTYITLMPRTLISTDHNQLPFTFENIEMVLESKSLAEKTRILGNNVPTNYDFTKDILFFATNLEILDLKYRTNKITAFVKQKPNNVQLLSVRKSYFYEAKLYIAAYNFRGKSVAIPTRIYQLS